MFSNLNYSCTSSKSRDTLPISENLYISLISMHIALNLGKKIMFMNNSD